MAKQDRNKVPTRIFLNRVKLVQSGLGKDHMKKTLLSGLKSDAKAAKAFRLLSFKDEDILCIECSDEANCQSWVKGLQMLLKVTQKWPQWITT